MKLTLYLICLGAGALWTAYSILGGGDPEAGAAMAAAAAGGGDRPSTIGHRGAPGLACFGLIGALFTLLGAGAFLTLAFAAAWAGVATASVPGLASTWRASRAEGREPRAGGEDPGTGAVPSPTGLHRDGVRRGSLLVPDAKRLVPSATPAGRTSGFPELFEAAAWNVACDYEDPGHGPNLPRANRSRR